MQILPPIHGQKNFDKTHCVADGREDDKVKTVTPEDCEKCKKYKSRYIEYPITVSKINQKIREYWKDKDCGQLVKIRPCGKEYGDKTYLGFLLGDLPFTLYITHDPETLELSCSTTWNPAIFVPELRKIIFGMESWWSMIESEEELRDITDDDIENVWYVKILKGMGGLKRMTKERTVSFDREKMLPCPFCGEDVAVLTDVHDLEECANFEDESCPCEQYESPGNCGYYTVVCSVNNRGCGSSSGYFPTKEQAIQAWNKRI